MSEDAEFFGVAYEPGEDEFLTDNENWPAVQIFLDCATQWQHLPMGGVAGLNYQSLAAVMVFHGVEPGKKTLEIFQKIRLIEKGALDAISERQALEQAQQVKPHG